MRTDRRALIVGIENYKNFNKVKYAINDADIISETLSEYQCQFSCTTLLDDQATTREILAKFRAMFAECDDDAVIIFFFAGHGVTIDDGTFLVTIDNETDDISPGVHLTRLIEIINSKRKPNQSCIFLLDCCHAGAFPLENYSISIDSIQETILKSTGVALIAATTDTEKAYASDQWTQGVFTQWLFHGLVGGAANNEGKITIFTLYDFISKAMAEHGQQTPVFKVTAFGKSPVLGDSFSPREEISISKLTDAKWIEIDTITRDRLRILRNNLDVDPESWTKHSYRDTSVALSDLITWRVELERSHPELKKHEHFRRYDVDIMQIQTRLSNLYDGLVVANGTVINTIGMGGFGTVYKVDIGSGFQAYKVYHSNQLHEYHKLKSFRRGYRAMKSLNHPNVVQVTGQTSAPEGFFMQYIDGPNFRDWWTDDLGTMLNILHIIAQALEHAHLLGVVHRDVKPENIIIDANNSEHPVPYLTDFDLAWYSTGTVFSTLANPVAVFGHYLYAAPEQYDKPDSEITRKCTTDVYGFGQLCFYAICKSDPERDSASSITTLKNRLGTWVNAEAAQKFLDMYQKCIQRVPASRFQSMNQVSAALLEIRNLLIDPDKSGILSQEKFIKELIFSIFGFEKEPTNNFTSRSGRTSINLQSIAKDSVHVKFDAIQGYTGISGTFDQQRNAINRRVDDVIDDMSKKHRVILRRHREITPDTYSTRIEIQGTILTLSGVEICREMIINVLGCIES
jgi:serine/threonine protein kinase